MKYSLTSEFKITETGVKVFRIKAEISFGNVSKGELGGWIEKEDNLDHSGSARVYGDAKVKFTPTVLQGYCKWPITKTDKYLFVGCKHNTFDNWIKWLDGKEKFETKRGSKEFELIEKAIRFLCESEVE